MEYVFCAHVHLDTTVYLERWRHDKNFNADVIGWQWHLCLWWRWPVDFNASDAVFKSFHAGQRFLNPHCTKAKFFFFFIALHWYGSYSHLTPSRNIWPAHFSFGRHKDTDSSRTVNRSTQGWCPGYDCCDIPCKLRPGRQLLWSKFQHGTPQRRSLFWRIFQFDGRNVMWVDISPPLKRNVISITFEYRPAINTARRRKVFAFYIYLAGQLS